MYMFKKIPLVFISTLICVSLLCAISDEETAAHKKTFWAIDLDLNMPGLQPEVVMWAIFDENPIPAYRQQLEHIKDVFTQALAAESDEKQLVYIEQAQMDVSWSKCFRDITGDNIYLLTAVLDHGFSSNSKPGTKWIVTKLRFVNDKPVCWVIPVEVEIGKTIKVVLSDENMFDIEKIYKEIMQR